MTANHERTPKTQDEICEDFSNRQAGAINRAVARENFDRMITAAEQRGAVKALRAVMELHAKRDDLQTRDGKPICDGCGDAEGWASEYPCPTVQAITGTLGDDEGDDDE